MENLLPPLLGLALFIMLWGLVAQTSPNLPDPVKTWNSAVELFSDPFYQKTPNDQGIGWNILASLKRVGIGFGMAALVGIPLGFMIGRFAFLDKMTSPIVSMLKPVSPLAWLPIGHAFDATRPTAVRQSNPAGDALLSPTRQPSQLLFFSSNFLPYDN